MDRNSVNWSGPMPAVTTPFHDDGRIDEAAFAANLEGLITAGATGFVVGGCTGEFWALSHEERKRLFDIAHEAVAGRVTLIAGTGAVSVEETVALTRHAEAAGCDGALILPPYFVKLSDDEIFAHFADVTGAIGLPVVLYNIPGNAVNAITPALAARLADLERVVAIKESSGDWNNYYGTHLAVHERLRVFCGPSSVFGVPAVQLGADGTIDCFPNVWQRGGLDLYFAAKAGETEKAAELQAMGRRLTDLFTSEGRTLYPATKAAMDMMGLPGGGTPRRPLRKLTGAPLKGLEAGLKTLGLL
ncbi:dihydrodipicolinate synthase family protein [Sandarakinorhabdus limnophila]|uniref:dihydrodipicolinate synthase family protein n=1 Tax=Sandarakinorhabdus limnophila TaxID=210512 RepID=UPI0026EA3361|nr:dihydrodipicolinate synthase family protein [Sandarakinorhabdus limnophila]MCM0034040.1 dihydrodipicolinate synthase family protein [Sandarakinorhabdus limnophila]